MNSITVTPTQFESAARLLADAMSVGQFEWGVHTPAMFYRECLTRFGAQNSEYSASAPIEPISRADFIQAAQTVSLATSMSPETSEWFYGQMCAKYLSPADARRPINFSHFGDGRYAPAV